MPFMSADLLLVWSSRKTGAIAYTGFALSSRGYKPPTGRADVLARTRGLPVLQDAGFRLCRHQHRLPQLPGIALPAWLRWPILVQFARLSATRPTLCASTASS
jgi:hypothetical protein